MQPGRWQPPRQHAPEADCYEETEQMQVEGNKNNETEETIQFDEGTPTTKEELISQWNDAFFSQTAEYSFFGETENEEEQCGWQDSHCQNNQFNCCNQSLVQLLMQNKNPEWKQWKHLTVNQKMMMQNSLLGLFQLVD